MNDPRPSLLDICRADLEKRGIDTANMGRQQVADAALAALEDDRLQAMRQGRARLVAEIEAELRGTRQCHGVCTECGGELTEEPQAQGLHFECGHELEQRCWRCHDCDEVTISRPGRCPVCGCAEGPREWTT